MPVPPSLLNTIRAIRKSMTSGGGKKAADLELYLLIHKLFRKPAGIVSNAESLDAVLALAPEIEAYRGKGSQIAAREFHQRLTGLIFHAKMNRLWPENRDGRLPKENEFPPSATTGLPWSDKLSAHFFQRVQGPPVRSQLAGRFRAMAWFALGELSALGRQPEHLARALKVAADPRGADVEREGAIQFLAAYWGEDDPDEATADHLYELEENPPDRSFLVTVLQAQIDLGLTDELGALCGVGNWDDAKETEKENEEE